MLSFKEGFKRARKSTGLTQAEFAEKYHYELATVRNWEQGRTVPEAATLEYLCEIFNCDLSYLFYQIDNTTHDLQFICDQIGLSENAVNALKTLSKDTHKDVLDGLLQNPSFSLFLFCFYALSSDLDSTEEWIKSRVGSFSNAFEDQIKRGYDNVRFERINFSEISNKLLNEYCDCFDRMAEIENALLNTEFAGASGTISEAEIMNRIDLERANLECLRTIMERCDNG